MNLESKSIDCSLKCCLSVVFSQKYNPTPDDSCLLFTRCAPSMAQTSWSINAGTAARWLFSSALAPHTSATPAMMTSSEWPVSPRRNCPIVLQVLNDSSDYTRLENAKLFRMHMTEKCQTEVTTGTNKWHVVFVLSITGPKGKQLEGTECPLHVVHPPTGEEFALGCGVCRNAHTF